MLQSSSRLIKGPRDAPASVRTRDLPPVRSDAGHSVSGVSLHLSDNKENPAIATRTSLVPDRKRVLQAAGSSVSKRARGRALAAEYGVHKLSVN